MSLKMSLHLFVFVPLLSEVGKVETAQTAENNEPVDEHNRMFILKAKYFQCS